MSTRPKNAETVCANCGVRFKLRTDALQAGQKYCSRVCQAVQQIKKIKVSCNYCEVLFEIVPSDLRKGRKFCSMSCSTKHQRKKIKTCCNYCGIPLEVKKSHFKDSGNYCSISCASLKKQKDLFLTPQETFFKNISKTEHEKGCWIYSVITANGYGHIRINKKTVLAHRYSYELHHCKIQDGLFICHSCDVPACINPDHLFAGTQLENIKDMVKKGRNKHLRGEGNVRSKLTEDQVREIRRLVNIDGITQEKLGKKFGVDPSVISEIKNYKKWKHI